MPQTLTEIRRLVSALEALSLEEQTLLRQRQYQAVNALQTRQLPLATRIAELANRPGVRSRLDDDLKARIRALIRSLDSKSRELDEAMAETRLSLAELDRRRQQVRSIRPAYSRLPYGGVTASAFCAEG